MLLGQCVEAPCPKAQHILAAGGLCTHPWYRVEQLRDRRNFYLAAGDARSWGSVAVSGCLSTSELHSFGRVSIAELAACSSACALKYRKSTIQGLTVRREKQVALAGRAAHVAAFD
jgi:hypothetical protein